MGRPNIITSNLIALAIIVSVAGAAFGDQAAPQAKSGSVGSSSLVYVAPTRDAPPSRISGGTRGSGSVMELLALAPDHTGLVLRSQPTLYWYVSRPAAARLEVTVIDETTPVPLLDITLDAAVNAGIQSVDLAGYGVRLRPEIVYRWFVSVVTDASVRSSDLVASGTIRYRAASDGETARISATQDPIEQASLYAGLAAWYDAVDVISGAIAATPDSAALHQARAVLLTQVGLDSVAAYDRGLATR